jgi:hypothetical protein
VSESVSPLPTYAFVTGVWICSLVSRRKVGGGGAKYVGGRNCVITVLLSICTVTSHMVNKGRKVLCKYSSPWKSETDLGFLKAVVFCARPYNVFSKLLVSRLEPFGILVVQFIFFRTFEFISYIRIYFLSYIRIYFVLSNLFSFVHSNLFWRKVCCVPFRHTSFDIFLHDCLTN